MHPRQDLGSLPASGAAAAQAPLVALAGSANSGKTTLFNLLTGSHYNTVNYPGATVEFALGTCKAFPDFPCRVMDTPGLTSLIPASLDEKVTVDALFHGGTRPDLVIAVVDANQMSRHLYLVRQLQDLGFSLVVVVTMTDLLKKRGRAVDTGRLSQLLDCPVIALDPRRKDALPALGNLLVTLGAAPGQDARAASPEAYRRFAAEMTEERVQGYYRALDEIERLAAPAEEGGAGRAPALDRILLHPVWGLAIFLFAMFVVFTSIFWLASPFMDLIDSGFGLLIAGIKHALPASWITDLIADGLVGGMGAVLVYLPQILILFFAMGYLEDSGYLARGAALVDKPLSKIGLNGKSFVPLLSGYACAIPAMMAARTIPNRFERNLTIFIIPLLSCSARLPVYTLLLAFLTPKDKPWIGGLALTGLYLLGLIIGAAVSTLASRLRRNRGVTGFILELPALRRPVFSVVMASTYHKAEQYVRKAGITIVIISLGLWVLTHTPPPRPDSAAGAATAAGREYVALSHSYAAQVGRFIEPITRPMGLDWRGGVAMMCGFAAREVFVSAMALVYRAGEGPGEGLTNRLLVTMSQARFEDTGERIFTPSSGLGIIVFFLIALQCFPTVAVSRNETGGWKLPLLQLAAYTGGAYVLAVATVQALRALGVA
jgi:ferrous iron transport protein B